MVIILLLSILKKHDLTFRGNSCLLKKTCMQQLPMLYLAMTNIFSMKEIFLKIDLMHKYDDFCQKLVLENIVRENSDDYCLDV